MMTHTHVEFLCVNPATVHPCAVRRRQEYVESGGVPVYTDSAFYQCDGYSTIVHLKDASGKVIGFRMVDASDTEVEVRVLSSKSFDQPVIASSQVTIDHSGRHVPAAEENRTK